MSESTEILLIRHGQSEGNAERRFGGHSATPLSGRGRLEAQATALAITSEGKLDAIYSSDLFRAVESAEYLSKAADVPVIKSMALRERNVGIMEGLTFEESAQRYPAQYQALVRRDFDHILEGGESYRQTLERSASYLDSIIAKHIGSRIAIYSHTGTICILFLHVIGALDSPNLRPVWIATANCGIIRIGIREDGFVRVLAVNDTRHLMNL